MSSAMGSAAGSAMGRPVGPARNEVAELAGREYAYGFCTDIDRPCPG